MIRLIAPNPGVSWLAAPAGRGGWAVSAADFRQLTKPRITVMVVVTTFIGFAMARHALTGRAGLAAELSGQWLILAATLAGTALSCMGASAINQFFERDIDALMHRTRNRPMPSGRVSPAAAAALGLGLALAGVAVLAIFANALTAAVSLFTIVAYALIYTPLKRVTTVSTIVGALPGALPPVMGATAASGRIGVAAALLFAILFLWQLPHFLAIAWLYRKDYARANLAMLPVVDPTGGSTFRQILLGCLALLPLGLLPTMLHVAGRFYFFGSLAAGLGFLAFGVALVLRPTPARARAMFFASLIYLPVVMSLMMIDQA